jgi:hypothetical protein
MSARQRRRTPSVCLALAAALPAALAITRAALADVYNDTVGDQAGTNDAEVDIASAQVTNDASNLYVQINLVGDIATANFGNYHIGFDTAPGGKTTPGVLWGNPFGLASGMDWWLGSWVNFGGGAELHQYQGDGSTNVWGPTIPGTSVALTPNSTTITIPLSALGLVHNSTLRFDVWSTYGQPGGQSAYDALSNPALAVADPWNGTPYLATLTSTYTVNIPEPTALGAVSLAAIAVLGRRRATR